MNVLRTPVERFKNLKDYNFDENYIEFNVDDGTNIRMHYIDENKDSGDVVLLMHGEPTWSYLYRHMIPILAKAGKRVIAPDLIGFGKSDKLSERADYTYERHILWTSNILTQLNLSNITFFGQDWGGLIGLRLVAQNPELFKGLVLSNTGMPIGKGTTDAFEAWKKFSQTVEHFNSGRIIVGGTTKELSDDEVAAYNAPFPDDSYLACARQFPTLVPMNPTDPSVKENIEAWEVLKKFEKPTLTLFGSEDKVFMGGEKIIQKLIPGANGMDHKMIDAGHFSQEDQPALLANAILNLYN
jgi:haloalkane dehalogenase